MIAFPDPNTTPCKAFKCEKYLDADGVECERYFEDPDYNPELADLIYDYLCKGSYFKD